ncbi:MAG: ROK family protein [Candidatus Longimicrobiales bacterium M2_2A_002]
MAATTAAGPSSVSETRGRPLAHLVLELIWHRRQISRAEIARTLGLSRSTVSEIVSSLLETGLVAEGGEGPSRGGRRPTLIVFNDDAHVIAGVDMGATHVSVVVTNLRGQVLSWGDSSHPVRDDPAGTRALIWEMLDEALDEVEGARDRLLGIGVSVPSPVDPRRPFSLSEVVMPAWRGRTGFEALRQDYGVPVFVDNDANLGALAEHWWGSARGLEDFTYIKLATGIGSGQILKGEIYRGSNSMAGEIGHVSIDPAGEPCICGNRGCLTTFAGATALLKRARELSAEYPDSVLREGEITLTGLEDAALQDDPVALQVFGEAAQHLGGAIAGLLNLMNPAAVILGGSITRVGERILVPLKETVMRRTLVSSVASTEIRMTSLGPRAFAVGAATHVLAEALDDPTLFPAMAAKG